MPPLRPYTLAPTILAATLASAALGTGARASDACTSHPLPAGKYGVLLRGPVDGGGTAENYSGILTASAGCVLKGSLTGGIFGHPISTEAVTGSYELPTSKPGVLKLQIAKAPAVMSFSIGRVKEGEASEIEGVAIGRPADATIELVAITPQTYTASSAKGTYVSICTGADDAHADADGFGAELVYSTFDGAGHFRVIAEGANDGTSFTTRISKGVYQVAADGSFIVHYPDSAEYSRYVLYGELVNSTELFTVLVDTTKGFGAYRSCAGKKRVF